MAEKSHVQSPFVHMCRDFNHILFFLEHGRRGWDLTFLPDNSFTDVEAVLPSLLIKVEQLGEIEDCAFLHETGVIALRDLKVRLGEIKVLRKRIWLQTKETYERKLEAEIVESLPGVGGRVILPLRKEVKDESGHGSAQAGSLNETKLSLEVDIGFAQEQEFKAGGDVEWMEGAEAKRDQDGALNQEPEVKAGKEMSASEPSHKDGRDTTKSESVPSADGSIAPEFALYVEEELEVEIGCDEKGTDEVPSEDEAINPEFALFVEDEVEDDAGQENTANVVDDKATRTEDGLLALEADCELDASSGTQYGCS